jgi:hypothetical protein
MWVEAIMQNAPGANTPAKQAGVLAFGLVLAAAGVVELIRPESLPRLLRYRSKEGDIRLYFAEEMERSPWKGRMAGGAAVLWGLLFAGLMINMMLNPTG